MRTSILYLQSKINIVLCSWVSLLARILLGCLSCSLLDGRPRGLSISLRASWCSRYLSHSTLGGQTCNGQSHYSFRSTRYFALMSENLPAIVLASNLESESWYRTCPTRAAIHWLALLQLPQGELRNNQRYCDKSHERRNHYQSSASMWG